MSDKKKKKLLILSDDIRVPSGVGTMTRRIVMGLKDEYEIIQSLCDLDLLLIDDIGKEHITDYSRQIIYSVINGRYERQKPTLFTTNCTSADLESKIDPATISRMMESNIAVKFDNIPDYRQRIGSEINK